MTCNSNMMECKWSMHELSHDKLYPLQEADAWYHISLHGAPRILIMQILLDKHEHSGYHVYCRD